MKFATILREAGFNVASFNKISEIPVVLYDRKNRIDSVEDIKFINPLFINNNNSFMDFYLFVKKLNNSEDTLPNSINVKIDEDSVILFYKTPHPLIFQRKLF